jgi:hypothetical protein
MRLAYSGGRMNYCIESFALLFKMIMEQAYVQQDSDVSCGRFLLGRHFQTAVCTYQGEYSFTIQRICAVLGLSEALS